MFSRYSSSSDQLVSSFLRNYYLCRFLYFSVEIGRNKKIFSTFFWNWRTREKEKMELESDNLEEKIREDNTEMNWGRFFGTVAREHLFVVFIKYQITVTVLLKYINGTHTVCDIQRISVKCHNDSFTKQSMVFHRWKWKGKFQFNKTTKISSKFVFEGEIFCV